MCLYGRDVQETMPVAKTGWGVFSLLTQTSVLIWEYQLFQAASAAPSSHKDTVAIERSLK
jgi:hypothetical protein